MVDNLKCRVDGCNNNRLSRGNGTYHIYCTKHHKQKYGMVYASSKDKRKRAFSNDECVLCGWSGPCDRHRLEMGKDGGKYIKGNVISLCPNCHRLLHLRGLTIK